MADQGAVPLIRSSLTVFVLTILFLSGACTTDNDFLRPGDPTILDELELDWLKVVAVAKGRARRAGAERLFVPGEKTPMQLPSDSPALLLIQQIRDEAHRFAISGHRAQRSRARKTSRLEQIPGLGPKKRRELLRQFGDARQVQAQQDELQRLAALAGRISQAELTDLAAALAETHGVDVQLSSLHRALERAGLSYKKRTDRSRA